VFEDDVAPDRATGPPEALERAGGALNQSLLGRADRSAYERGQSRIAEAHAEGGGDQAQQQSQQEQVQQMRRKFARNSRFPNFGPRGYGLVDLDGSPLLGNEDGDGVMPPNVKPLLRPTMVNRAKDTLLALKHNRGGRRSWTTV